MNLLAIETAFESCSVALSQDGELRERFQHAPRAHASLVLPWVEELLAEGGIGLGALDAIAFSRGPGSFTSLRIGISIVQGLAWGADLPVVPVSSLRATAQTAAANGIERAVVAMDARMNEVFTGRFELRDGLMQASGEERVCDPALLEGGDISAWAAVGNGFERFQGLAELAAGMSMQLTDVWPRATDLAVLAVDWLSSNEPLPAEQAQPVYLRDKVADKPAAKKS